MQRAKADTLEQKHVVHRIKAVAQKTKANCFLDKAGQRKSKANSFPSKAVMHKGKTSSFPGKVVVLKGKTVCFFKKTGKQRERNNSFGKQLAGKWAFTAALYGLCPC
jgi:hypothetical protein